jgi:hypothetical protein
MSSAFRSPDWAPGCSRELRLSFPAGPAVLGRLRAEEEVVVFEEPKVLDVRGETAFGVHLLRVRLEIRMKAHD